MTSFEQRAALKERLAAGQLRLEPLTFPQRELWEASPVPVEDPANHICCMIEVHGRLALEHVTSALKQVVERQDALRVSFLPGKEKPLQVIKEAPPLSFHYRELESHELAPEALEAIAGEIFRRPFDLLRGPLYRTELLRRAVDDHVLVFAIHHAIADGWTLGVFVQELCVAYFQSIRGLAAELPPLPLTYSAWGAAERAFWQPAELKSRVAFWAAQLQDRTRLWQEHDGAAPDSDALERDVTYYSSDFACAARAMALQSGATLFSTLLAAFQLALAEWTGVDDILVGAPVANRTKQAANETMGYFAGIVPLRGRANPARPFLESVRAVHENTVDCLGHAMPFVELVRALGEPAKLGYNPIYEVRFALQNHPIPDVSLPGLSANLRMCSTGTARFHLACEITEDGDRLEVVWIYRKSLFAKADVESLSSLFEASLGTVQATGPVLACR